ncbi:CBS domain-containing protein [Erythrobacter sanguineus]|jgi:CBS domain-containing protein|uniref:CBS domain-containing protein n=1 Tax=Erythrobacter sanguineus TaxID=198312 RepID=A0A1M7S251_9SPHN|nr:CBS domain-containing protein [Erythrobacter sanguineus]SHN52342.1 CBS domain-containing protein [Erythrobacter sanguineus]
MVKVAEVMHRGASWVDPNAPLADIAERMEKEDIGAVPVGEDDRLIGMVTDRDIAVRAFAEKSDPLQLTARDVMSEPIIFCTANENLEDAVRIMERKQVRRLPVIDENRRMVGMLSLGDVAASAPASLAGETLQAVSAHHA